MKLLTVIKSTAAKYSPEILIGIGIAGMATSTVMAVRATPKALDILKEIDEAHKDDEDKKAKAVDIVKKVGPVYAPSAAVCVVSIGCIIGGTRVGAKRSAAWATAYALSENAMKDYQAKVIETFGEKKEQAVRDDIAKDKIKNDPVTNKEVIITSGNNNTLCYDMISGRYFMSDIETLRRVENKLNKKLMSEMFISLNEYYYEVGLRCTEQGDNLGFNINDGLIDLEFSAQIADDGRPCICVSFHVAPRYGYGDY